MSKLVASLRDAIWVSGLRDGMCVSFHHHLRSGDYVLNMTMDAIAAMGIRDITINASSIHDGHAPLVKHMESGVLTGLETNCIGPVVGRAVSEGKLRHPVVFRTHGGRPSDIETGKSKIDVAFIAAPTADCMGNCTGKIGPSACGSLGYAFADARHADKVVVITDNLVPYPLADFSIDETCVDYVVKVDAIGDPNGIVSGTTRITRDPIALRIARTAARVIEASGLLRDGFSFQTGAGGASLAVGQDVKDIMLKRKIRGSFALGGTTGYLVDMLEVGCFESIMDVQCFDLRAVESLRNNPRHIEVTGSHYASPTARSCLADSLDAVVFGATQIDVDFNVNVHTDSNGYVIGGSGGHSDVAAGAKLALIVAPLSRARLSIVVDRVLNVSTPGRTVDALITQCGVAVNPARGELREKLLEAGIGVVDIEALRRMAEELNGVPQPPALADRVVGKILYRDGTEIDQIYQVKA